MRPETDTIYLVLLKSWESDPSLGEAQAAVSGVAASWGKRRSPPGLQRFLGGKMLRSGRIPFLCSSLLAKLWAPLFPLSYFLINIFSTCTLAFVFFAFVL